MTEPSAAGRHQPPDQPTMRLTGGSGALVRPAILLAGLVAGFAIAAWHWIVNTALLGARLPTALHVLLVGVFLVVALTLSVIAFWLGRRGVDRRSQARRREWKDRWL